MSYYLKINLVFDLIVVQRKHATTKFLHNELDSNKKLIAVFLDRAKAFGTVNHDVLLQMLPSFVITNESFLCFKSYLKN